MDLWDTRWFFLGVGWWIQRLEEYVVWISRTDDSYLRLWILNKYNYNHRIHHIIRVSTKRFIINVTSVHNLVLLFQNEQLCHFKIFLILTHLSMQTPNYVMQLILDHFCYAVMSYCWRAAMLLIFLFFLQFSAQQACERMQISILCPFEFGFNFLLCVYLPRGWNFRGILNWKPI